MTVDRVDANSVQRAYWSDVAGPTWVQGERTFERMLDPHGEAIVQLLDVHRGERVLDVGCGFGPTSLAVARLVGADGWVHGVDISPVMIERARRRAADDQVDRVSFGVADAQVDDLVGGPLYDAVVSRFGVMFFADPTEAFANLRRAARIGGRLAFACWQGPDVNPFFSLGPRLIRAVIPDPPSIPAPDTPGPLAFADPARIESVLNQSGWTGIAITPRRLPLRFDVDGSDGLDAAVGHVVNTELGRIAAAQLGPDRFAAMVTEIRAQIDQHRSAGVLEFDSNVWLVSATA